MPTQPLLSIASVLADGSREQVHGLPMTTKVDGVEINGDFLFLAIKNSPVAPNGDFLDGMGENCSIHASANHKYLGFAWRRVKSVLTAEFTALMSLIAQGPDPDSLFMAVCLVNSQKEACIAAGDTTFTTLFPRALDALEEEAVAAWAICPGLAQSGPRIAATLLTQSAGASAAQALTAVRKAASAAALAAAQAAATNAAAALTAAQAALDGLPADAATVDHDAAAAAVNAATTAKTAAADALKTAVTIDTLRAEMVVLTA